ncbi:hypothetical protein [Streptomyces sp. NRRL F-2799]|uniref:hypothetical protein n=1 Tax=Streptomyces sp. NRRL F-2799 TaxID=1463844 RepID=UPI00131A5F1F|nr:hypothetical protein [Streptomyces sp. NRRL F-2799]
MPSATSLRGGLRALRGEVAVPRTTLVAIRRPDADAAVMRLLELVTRRTAG